MFFETFTRLIAIGEHYKNRQYSASEITRIIRRQFPATDFSFRTHRDTAVDPDMIVVAGLYDCFNDSQDLPSIEITLCYHPDQKIYFTDLIDWETLAFDLAECICHELIHRQQYRSKQKFKPYVSKVTDPHLKAEQEYLGGGDELDAYGFSIAAESIVRGCLIQECVMYGVYQTTFDNDTDVVIQLEKEIQKYINQLELNNEQVEPRTRI
jgi:hypothetical protein